jgi:flagellar biosynthesis/type III secretory pathway chaperone
MAGLLSKLLKILRMETELYRRLLDLMDRERMALLRSGRTEIEACTAEKGDLIDQLQAADRQRTEVVNRLARHTGRPAAETTLSLLAQTAAEPFRAELRQARCELLELTARIQEENQRGKALCRHASELLRAAHGVLKGLAADGFVYHRGGRLERTRLNGKLVSDEI